VKDTKIRKTYQATSSPASDFLEDVNREAIAQAYQHIVGFLHRYKNNIEFVTKEELVAVTNIKEPIITRVLDKLRKAGILKPKETRYYINKDNLKTIELLVQWFSFNTAIAISYYCLTKIMICYTKNIK